MHIRVTATMQICGIRLLPGWRTWCLCLVLLLHAAAPAIVQADSGGALMETWSRYTQEVRGRTEPVDRGFREFWAQEFVTAVGSSQLGDSGRIPVLRELGALQRGLGQVDKSVDTYSLLAHEAFAHGDSYTGFVAMNTQWNVAAGLPDDRRLAIAETWENQYRQLLRSGEKPDKEVLGRYADCLMEIAQFYVSMAQKCKEESSPEADRKARSYYREASKRFDSALTLPERETSTDTKLFRSGRASLSFGDSDKAAALFGQLLNRDQKTYARMWVAQLDAKARYGQDSPEYRQRLEAVRNEFPPDDYLLPLTQELGMSYMRAGQYDMAAKILQDLVGKDGDREANAYNLFLLGESYFRMGNTELAKELWSDLLRQFGATSAASLARESLAKASGETDAKDELIHAIPRTKDVLDESIRAIDAGAEPAAASQDGSVVPSQSPSPLVEGSSQARQLPSSGIAGTSYWTWGLSIAGTAAIVVCAAVIWLRVSRRAEAKRACSRK